jgi:hypothetical protein
VILFTENIQRFIDYGGRYMPFQYMSNTTWTCRNNDNTVSAVLDAFQSTFTKISCNYPHNFFSKIDLIRVLAFNLVIPLRNSNVKKSNFLKTVEDVSHNLK